MSQYHYFPGLTIFLPSLEAHPYWQIYGLQTPGSPFQNKNSSDLLVPLLLHQLLNSSVCKSNFPTFSTRRPQMPWCRSLGSRGDNQVKTRGRPSATAQLLRTSMAVSKELILMLKSRGFFGFCSLRYCGQWVTE